MTKDRFVPTLETARLILRSFATEDAPEIYQLFSDPEVMTYWNTPPMQREEEAHGYIDETLDACRRGTQWSWAVVHKATYVVIGMCALAQIDVSHRRAEIGFAQRRDHWGQGFMGEGIAAVLDHAFSGRSLNRVEAYIDPPNIRSLRLIERLGFQREGYLRQRRWAGGRAHNTWIYALLHDTWQEREAALGSRSIL